MTDLRPAGGRPPTDQLLSAQATLVVLLVTTALLLLGSGLFGTLTAVRASIEGIPTGSVGLIMSAYFAGFIAGTFACVHIASQVGHIRAFAVLAAVVTASVLAQSLWVSVVAWIIFRFIAGICLAGLALILESWLNAQTLPERRGHTFAVYMVVNLLALACGQLLLTTADPAGFALFSVVAILFALSLVPTAVARVEAPVLQTASGLSLGDLVRRSPVGTAGCLAAGVTGGAFWGMTPVFLAQSGYLENQIALFMFVTIVGGMLAQLPVGRFSDGRDRRRVIVLVAAAAAGSSVLVMLAALAPFGALAATGFLFGACMFPLYGLSVARAHDLLTPDQALAATRGLLLVFGSGAAFGPLAAGFVMSALGAAALFGWIALIFAGLAVYSAWRLRFSEVVAPADQAHFVAAIPTTQEALEMLEAEAYDDRTQYPAFRSTGDNSGSPET
ncbi:MAG: MFS transporter [Chromatiales bacterium]|nr:MFS transporter [Chromatiales bacterium]